MNPTDSVFHEAFSKLLSEIFEGPPGNEAYVLNPGDPGLLRQLETLSAATASTPSTPAKPPIAAHVDHLHYGLSLVNRWMAGEENPWADADWNASWRITSCHGRTVARIVKQAASGGDFMARDCNSEARLGWIGCSRGNLHGRSYRVSSRRDPPDSGSGQELAVKIRTVRALSV